MHLVLSQQVGTVCLHVLSCCTLEVQILCLLVAPVIGSYETKEMIPQTTAWYWISNSEEEMPNTLHQLCRCPDVWLTFVVRHKNLEPSICLCKQHQHFHGGTLAQGELHGCSQYCLGGHPTSSGSGLAGTGPIGGQGLLGVSKSVEYMRGCMQQCPAKMPLLWHCHCCLVNHPCTENCMFLYKMVDRHFLFLPHASQLQAICARYTLGTLYGIAPKALGRFCGNSDVGAWGVYEQLFWIPVYMRIWILQLCNLHCKYRIILFTLYYNYLQYMSQVTYGNPQTSVVIRRRFPWKSVRKFVDCLWRAHGIVFWDLWNHLSGSAESSFGNPQNCLSGARGFVLWESSKQSLGDCRLLSPRVTKKSVQDQNRSGRTNYGRQ